MAIPLVTVLNNLKTVQIAQVPCFGGRVPWRELNITHYHSVCECVCAGRNVRDLRGWSV